MSNLSLRSFIKSIIREHKEVSRYGDYSVDARSLPLHDKKIFLSHILDSEEYEDALYSGVRTECYFKEHERFIQSLIDNEINTVYCNDMYESGLIPYQHKDNGEVTWIRRG